MSRPSVMRRPLLALVAFAVVAAGLVALPASSDLAVDCPPGSHRPAANERELSPERLAALAPQYRGPNQELGDVLSRGCFPDTGFEPFLELAMRDAQFASVRLAPAGAVLAGANANAAAEREQLVAAAAEVAGTDGSAWPYDRGPIDFTDPRYEQGGGNGIIHSTGRIDDFHYDAETGYLFAAIGTGGVWLSEDMGERWRPITDQLQTTVASAVTYTTAGGPQGTVVVVTGEHTFGHTSYLGYGVFYSRDLGRTWKRAQGPPSDAFGFAAEVDPTQPNVVYAATGKGLWRSTDAGATFVDVVLPTGDCAGVYDPDRCLFANMVTDVVVKSPGGVGADTDGGDVIAAVGWRAGNVENPETGTPQSPQNGIYRSETGQPGSFGFLDGLSSAVGGQERLGRIELGPTVGEQQDHDVLYAIVQDAVLLNGGFRNIDAPEDDPGDDLLGLPNPTVFNGVYASTDFGQSWVQLADDNEMSTACPANESVYCIPGVIEPGAQAWYNLWIAPDPTKQVGGIPTRLVLGLEEVWANRATNVPAVTPATSFHVIGRYYSAADCLLVATNCAVSSQSGIETTHPDQHDGIIIPTVDGNARLLAGHDGGLSSQVATATQDFNQNSWVVRQRNMLETLLPYSAVIANDGVAYAGLQDNGQVKIDPQEGNRLYETYGADGTFTAVDPEDSDYVWESTQNAGLNVSTDGGRTWTAAAAPSGEVLFVNPLKMDPLDPNHLVTGGTVINETLIGPDTPARDGWKTVFDLGPSQEPQPGDVEEVPLNQMSAIDVRGEAIYAGYCSLEDCDVLNTTSPFASGIATNVNGPEPPAAGTSKGWHFAKAEGLPERYITSVTIDPYDATGRTVYVTLGGYSREWTPPGSMSEPDPLGVGEGHVFKSTDAGGSFVDISGNLPDITHTSLVVRGEQLIVGTDNGVYISSNKAGAQWAALGAGQLPNTPIDSLQLKADDPDFLFIGVYGRGMWAYRFPDADVPTRRLAGADRIRTAVQVSKAQQANGADTVVIARSDAFADALAGAPLASDHQAPILLTPSAELAAAVAAEVQRLGATHAILLGGTEALSEDVATQLEAAGVTEVERIGGKDRFETAALIAQRIGGGEAYFVEGRRGWPDALAVGPVAADQRRPILLVERNAIPDATKAAIDQLGTQRAWIVGGPAAVSQNVEDALRKQMTLEARIDGPDRYATSVEAVEHGFREGLTPTRLWLAQGAKFADALSAGPSVTEDRGLLLLVHPKNLDRSPASRDYLRGSVCIVERATVLGGRDAIADRVLEQASRFLDGCPDPRIGTPPDPAPTAGTGGSGEALSGEVIAGPFGFEEGNEGWTVTLSGNPSTRWSRSEPGRESTTSFAVSPYHDLADTSLTSPQFEGTGTAIVRYWHRIDAEGGGFDELAVEWSKDGTDWQTLESFGGQNVGYPDFAQRVVTFPADGSFQVRFRFFSDYVCSSIAPAPGAFCAAEAPWEGVWVDDVQVEIAQ